MIVGLTGISGAGKSTVAAIFAEKGFTLLDCDRIVHQEVYYDPQVLAAVARVFGADCIDQGTVNRPRLREKTLGNPKATKKLNDTVLPFIVKHIQGLLKKAGNTPVLLDAPLLFESGLDAECHFTVGVIAPRSLAIKRIVERDQLTTLQAERRLSAQKDEGYFTEKCDYILRNDGGIDGLRQKTEQLIKTLYDQAL